MYTLFIYVCVFKLQKETINKKLIHLIHLNQKNKEFILFAQLFRQHSRINKLNIGDRDDLLRNQVFINAM